MLLTEPHPRHLSLVQTADRSDRRLFETRHLLEHASEHPASIRCRRLFQIETWRLLRINKYMITSFTVITKLISIFSSNSGECPDFAEIYHVCF